MIWVQCCWKRLALPCTCQLLLHFLVDRRKVPATSAVYLRSHECMQRMCMRSFDNSHPLAYSLRSALKYISCTSHLYCGRKSTAAASYLWHKHNRSFTFDTVSLPLSVAGCQGACSPVKIVSCCYHKCSMCWLKSAGDRSGKRSKMTSRPRRGPQSRWMPLFQSCWFSQLWVNSSHREGVGGSRMEREERKGNGVEWLWYIEMTLLGWGQTGSRCLNDSERLQRVMCTK